MTTILAKCQKESLPFDEFKKKFVECNFPITQETFESHKIYSNNPCNITKQEFDSFIKSDLNNFWIFRPYTKQQPNYFNYVTGLKFDFYENKKLIALIYLCDYLTDDYNAGKEESILAIYNESGLKLSSIPIAGGYGDTLTFTSIINNPKDIIIDYTRYSNTGEEKYKRHYYIDANGIILKKD